MSKTISQQIVILFEEWDKLGSGTITKQALSSIMKQLAGFQPADLDTLLCAARLDKKNVINYHEFLHWLTSSTVERSLSLAKGVVQAGGIDAWNWQHKSVSKLCRMLDGMCCASTVEEALEEVEAVRSLGHDIWAYAYMRRLHNRDARLFYSVLAARPSLLLPVVYTPTVGEACQKFGTMPQYRRGCYLAITQRGRFKEILREYAEAELHSDSSGRYLCDCIVFSDGGRILGLGDLGAWGMGIPIGKLDLYTVCAGINPQRTIPVIIDAGCHGPEGNTDHLTIRDHELYTGLKQARATHTSSAGTLVNTAYYGEGNVIEEFMEAATDLFGRTCLLQFEDFNSNDAFPLLETYRERYLSYNDDIQGTAAVALAGLLGALKLREPACKDLKAQLRQETFLFHGAGSANVGVMNLLRNEAGVPAASIFATNSRGLIWRSSDGSTGSFRNDEQKAFAQVGQPTFDTRDLVALVEHIKPSCLVGAVGVAPNCFTKRLVEAMVRLNSTRPVIFALSNPKTKAEITAQDAYTWSNGQVIFGSGTWFAPVEVKGRVHSAGQVNNVYIFPGVSFGAVCCQARTIPERFFLAAAEAVATSLDELDIASDSVVPRRENIREVSLNVSAAVALTAQEMALAGKTLGRSLEEVKTALAGMRWNPGA